MRRIRVALAQLNVRVGDLDGNLGKITDAYDAALKEHELTAFMGADASSQPGQLQEAMLHETAVSWIRVRMAQCRPAKPWEETPEAFEQRLRGVVASINGGARKCNVRGLCNRFLDRVAAIRKAKGGRIAP